MRLMIIVISSSDHLELCARTSNCPFHAHELTEADLDSTSIFKTYLDICMTSDMASQSSSSGLKYRDDLVA